VQIKERPDKIRGITTIIFDVDGTLAEFLSWMKITEGLAEPENKAAAVAEHKRLYQEFKNNQITYKDFKLSILHLWQSTGNAKYDYMRDMFESWELKEDAYETIQALQQYRRLCLISGAVDLYVEVVAEKLGVTDYRANTKLDWDKFGNLTDFHFYPDDSQKKVEQFFEYCKEHDIPWEACAIVGDGESDYGLFQILLGIAINAFPDERLEALAYCVITSLTELTSLFPPPNKNRQN
jgi:phosphoserine phosphatase